MNVVLEGITAGLLLSTLIGPVFFLLLDTAMNRGTRSALALDVGIILSDACWIGLFTLGWAGTLTGFMQSNQANLVGGAIFMVFGLLMALKPVKKATSLGTETLLLRNFARGFILNSLNPSVPLFWLASVLFATSRFENQTGAIWSFFSAALITVFLIDLLKIFGARKLRHVLNPRNRMLLGRATGLLLIAFGVVLVARYFG